VPPKKKVKKPGRFDVTFGEIREQGPCAGEWSAFLKDMKSTTNSAGVRIGPHSHDRCEMVIPLAKILKTKSSAMSGFDRVEWILDRVGRLGGVAIEFREHFNSKEFRDKAFFDFLNQKKKKKSNGSR
jgi:hypothetical protein